MVKLDDHSRVEKIIRVFGTSQEIIMNLIVHIPPTKISIPLNRAVVEVGPPNDGSRG